MQQKDFSQDIQNTIKVLGEEKISCLTNLFIQAKGEPPQIAKKRYRADNPQQMQILDELE